MDEGHRAELPAPARRADRAGERLAAAGLPGPAPAPGGAGHRQPGAPGGKLRAAGPPLATGPLRRQPAGATARLRHRPGHPASLRRQPARLRRSGERPAESPRRTPGELRGRRPDALPRLAGKPGRYPAEFARGAAPAPGPLAAAVPRRHARSSRAVATACWRRPSRSNGNCASSTSNGMRRCCRRPSPCSREQPRTLPGPRPPGARGTHLAGPAQPAAPAAARPPAALPARARRGRRRQPPGRPPRRLRPGAPVAAAAPATGGAAAEPGAGDESPPMPVGTDRPGRPRQPAAARDPDPGSWPGPSAARRSSSTR